ncbi:MAG: glycoside hydrolase family 127 protein [Candidatus Hydrogenedentes bacterium]|nr:glycoside hydrolase family 127 protein [Candidatus Hydrogenedentota bacterium]
MPRMIQAAFIAVAALCTANTLAEELAIPHATLRLEGEVGRRTDAVLENWVLPMPDANPALLEMFRLRDRDPAYANPVPWAGEFVGKYLQSAIQLLQFTDSPELRAQVEAVVAELISTQSPEGYLGPFRKDERLLGQWDLWGHYHVLYALHAWYKATGDQAALDAATKAADFICNTYLDTDKRVHDAGSHEMNMAIMHALGILHRETGNERYFRLMKEIEKDWEKAPAGDYLRTGVDKVPFYKTPKPRWESLHSMQGLGELYRITSEEKYRDALLHFWHSIRESDIHNAGSFSTGEGAIGNPFKPGAIETCCTVAWIAYSVDALRLSADSTIADAIELATLNTVLGYEHPSGRWCTYDTPMDGKRPASAHTIVFQSREGTPELNCCSVNGARGLSIIADWGVLESTDGLYVNYYGPGTVKVESDNLRTWTLTQTTEYPAEGNVAISVEPGTSEETTLYFRIPAWSHATKASLNGDALPEPKAGDYLALRRSWKPGDTVTLDFDMTFHTLAGDHYVDFRGSLYRGPLLLAYDQKHNTLDPAELPALDLQSLNAKPATTDARFHPMVLFSVDTDKGPLQLVDYATAGAHGTYYQSWLPMKNLPPVAMNLMRPGHGDTLPKGEVFLQWSPAGKDLRYTLTVARDAAMNDVVDTITNLEKTAHFYRPPAERGDLYWTVNATGPGGEAGSQNGPFKFTIDPALPEAESGLLLDAPLHGKSAALTGNLIINEHARAVPGRDGKENGALYFDGRKTKLVYDIGAFPARNYSLSAWFAPDNLAANDDKWHHIFSAWAQGSDDPLRVSVQNKRLVANIEMPDGGAHCPGAELKDGEWTHVAVVKEETQLRLYVNGALIHTTTVPEELKTSATKIGLGCNPNFGELEGYQGAISDVRFYAGALTDAAIQRLQGIEAVQ